MTVFEHYGLKQINNILDSKFQDVLNLHPHELTAQHFFGAGVQDEHKQLLKDAYKLTNRQGGGAMITVDTKIGLGSERLGADILLNGIDFLIPHYMQPLRLTKLDNPAAEAVVEWAYGAHEVLRQIVSLKTCLGYLNAICDDALQIVAFLPALAKYMEAREDSEKDLASHRWTFKVPDLRYEKSDHSAFTKARKRLISGRAATRLPRVPRAVINECCDANTFLLCCAMILESAAEKKRDPDNLAAISVSLASRARRSPNFSGDVVAASHLGNVALPIIADQEYE